MIPNITFALILMFFLILFYYKKHIYSKKSGDCLFQWNIIQFCIVSMTFLMLYSVLSLNLCIESNLKLELMELLLNYSANVLTTDFALYCRLCINATCSIILVLWLLLLNANLIDCTVWFESIMFHCISLNTNRLSHCYCDVRCSSSEVCLLGKLLGVKM